MYIVSKHSCHVPALQSLSSLKIQSSLCVHPIRFAIYSYHSSMNFWNMACQIRWALEKLILIGNSKHSLRLTLMRSTKWNRQRSWNIVQSTEGRAAVETRLPLKQRIAIKRHRRIDDAFNLKKQSTRTSPQDEVHAVVPVGVQHISLDLIPWYTLQQMVNTSI